MDTQIFERFLTKQDESLDTGKYYSHNFQWKSFESSNCIFYVWHKKEIKLINSKDLWSTMAVFFIKDSLLKIEQLTEDVKRWIITACKIFSAFDEENGWTYNFLPYFQTKLIDEKNQLFEKIWLNIVLKASAKWVLLENNEWIVNWNVDSLNSEEKVGFLFGLILLYGKFEAKGDKLSAIKIQLPLFWQYLIIWDKIRNIQKELQNDWIFIQISENIQWDKHIYEITSNDYELLGNFSKLYLPVENFTQITKREQAQEAVDALKSFLNTEWESGIISTIDASCVKILQKF